ncbi:MAG: DUF4783 domain-containing protein [Chitinophagaceae bacterium]|nr:DUF4783 domain-containing protein [Chitinophagaceae bacterium]
MKPFFCSILVVLAITLSSFQHPVEINNTVTALKRGNAAQLCRNLDKTVKVFVSGVDKRYSAQKTSLIMQKFFATHKVTDFVVSQIGNTSTGILLLAPCKSNQTVSATWIIFTKVSRTRSNQYDHF